MIYKELIKSKDGFDIPIFENNKTMHSKYSPIKEALLFGNELNKTNSTFTIILGLGGGYHIEEFLKNNSSHFILVIENSIEDIKFLSQIECVKKLTKASNVKIISKEEIIDTIGKNYLPAIHSGINILSHRAWTDCNLETTQKIHKQIKYAINQKTKDYSVQCHFGLLWQKNILQNLYLSDKIKQRCFSNTINNKTIDSKSAAIIAAGPSLDFSIEKIKLNREKYFIIATDTAMPIIKRHNLSFDVAVSIDGQNISYKHYIGLKSDAENCNSVFIFDLQANWNATKYANTFCKNIFFTKSGHPLCDYAEITNLKRNCHFTKLDSGAGTVTISAIDFASKCGFKNIEVFGADFSYIFNKPYAKGTYLDKLYRLNESKINSAENNFVNLLYRTEVTKEKINYKNSTYNKIQNPVLDSYKKTFIDWITKNNYDYKYDDFIYHLSKKSNAINCLSDNVKFNFDDFLKQFCLDLKTFDYNKNIPAKISELTNLEIALLPYIAFIRNKNSELDYTQSVKLAMSKILEYNYMKI